MTAARSSVASPTWDDAPLRRLLAGKADALVGGPDAVLVVDDTALPKQGRLSVGVARQYCGRLGKRANCQVLVSLTLARGEVPVPAGLRLFLPEAGAGDAERCARAGVPEEHRRASAKTDIALAELDRAIAAGAVHRGAVHRPRGRGRRLRRQRRLPPGPERARPGLGGRRPEGAERVRGRRRAALAEDRPRDARASARCRARSRSRPRPCWGRGVAAGELAPRDKGPLAAEFAALRVRPAEGEQLRSGRHPPGAEVWLVGERRATGERKYHLANLPADASLEELAATIKARPRPAAAGRPCGDGSGAARSTGARAGAPAAQGGWTAAPSRGLGHFEGRSWTGLHRHALMAMLAFCFLQHLRLKERGKKRGRPPGATTAADPARRPPSAARAVPRRPRPVPVLPDRPRTGATVRSAKVALAV